MELTKPVGSVDSRAPEFILDQVVADSLRLDPGPPILRHKTPTVDCSVPPPLPPPSPAGANLDANVQQTSATFQNAASADVHAASFGSSCPVFTTGAYVILVAQCGGHLALGDYAHSNGQSYAAFGNFNYGATCNAAGLGLEGCQEVQAELHMSPRLGTWPEVGVGLQVRVIPSAAQQ